MRQRRSGVRSETTAARLTRQNLARERATIYPVLTFKPHPLTPSPGRERGSGGEDKRSGAPPVYGLAPGFVRRRPVNRRDLTVGHAEIDGELTAWPTVRSRRFTGRRRTRSEEHTSELQSRLHLVCRLLLEKKKK